MNQQRQQLQQKQQQEGNNNNNIMMAKEYQNQKQQQQEQENSMPMSTSSILPVSNGDQNFHDNNSNNNNKNNDDDGGDDEDNQNIDNREDKNDNDNNDNNRNVQLNNDNGKNINIINNNNNNVQGDDIAMDKQDNNEANQQIFNKEGEAIIVNEKTSELEESNNNNNNDNSNSSNVPNVLSSSKTDVMMDVLTPSAHNTTRNNTINSSSPLFHDHLHPHPPHHLHHHHNPLRHQISNTTSSSTVTTSIPISKSLKKRKAQTYQRPPDGGWGWMVVLASFIINFIADGVSLSFGLIFVELADFFHESKSKTSWIGSLFLSIPLLTGPIASTLVDHFGCRKVTIVGAILAASGFFCGQFATCIEHLYVAFSVSGFGLALCFVSSVVSVAYWFDKRRSLATGLSVCGTGIGTFVFPPFISYLLEEYKWQGTLLILSAVFLNMVCCGFLIRDLNIDPEAEGLSSSLSSSSDSDNTSDLESSLSGDSLEEEEGSDSEDINKSRRSSHSPTNNELGRHRLLKSRTRPLSECQAEDEPIPRHTASLIYIPTFVRNQNTNNDQKSSEDVAPAKELTFRRGGYLYNLINFYPQLLKMFLPYDMQCDDLTVKTKVQVQSRQLNQNPSPPLPPTLKASQKVVEFGSIHQIGSVTKLNGNLNGNAHIKIQPEEEIIEQKPRNNSTSSRIVNLLGFTRKFNNFGTKNDQHQQHLQQQHGNNRLRNLRLPRGSLTYRSAMLVINKYRLKASSAPDIYRTSMATINEEKSSTCWNYIKDILVMDLTIFKSIRYTIFCLSNFLLCACVDVPYVYLPDQVVISGASSKQESSNYISILGVFNTVGVVLVGYIGDKSGMDACFVYGILVAISGISIATLPLTAVSLTNMLQSAIYGFCISPNYSLGSVILVELISLDSFTTAYGMLLLGQGFGSLVGPPVAGWMFDESGNYNNAFYVTGFIILLSGLLVVPIGRKKNCFLCNSSSKSDSDDDEDNDDDAINSKIKMKNPSKLNCLNSPNNMKNSPLPISIEIEEDSKI